MSVSLFSLKSTYRPSTLALRLLVKAYSTPTSRCVRVSSRILASWWTEILGLGRNSYEQRLPNLIWEQLAADELLASFIVDGHHLPPATVKAAIRAKVAGRAILIDPAICIGGDRGRQTTIHDHSKICGDLIMS